MKLQVGGIRTALASFTIGDEHATPSFDALSDVERARIATFQSHRRVREFVAGRLAARSALSELMGELPRDFAIDRHVDGAPKLVGLRSVVSLTITHGEHEALAWVARGEVSLGIDLTDHADAARIRRVARRAFPRDHERALALASDAAAVRAWAAKEAAAKALRMGLLEQAGFSRIEITSLEPPRVQLQAVSWIAHDESLPAPTVVFTDHPHGVLALAVAAADTSL